MDRIALVNDALLTMCLTRHQFQDNQRAHSNQRQLHLKQKGRKIEVTDDPELLRHQKNTGESFVVSLHLFAIINLTEKLVYLAGYLKTSR